MAFSAAVHLILWALLLMSVTSAGILPPVSASESSYVSFSDSNKEGSELSQSVARVLGAAVDDLMLPFQAGISSSTDPSVVDGSTQVSPDQPLMMVIDTLRRASTYNVMAEALSALGLRVLPRGSTLFVPTDEALSVIQTPSTLVSLVQYHISLLQLRFPQLLGLNAGTRISTLLPNKTIVVTNNSMLEYRINNVLVAYPDMYNDAAISVHGIGGIFNATLYGDGDPSVLAADQNTASTSSTPTVSAGAASPAPAPAPAPPHLPISEAPAAGAITSTTKAAAAADAQAAAADAQATDAEAAAADAQAAAADAQATDAEAAAAAEVRQSSATSSPTQNKRALPPIGLFTQPDLQDTLSAAAGLYTSAKHEAVTFMISLSLMLSLYLINNILEL